MKRIVLIIGCVLLAGCGPHTIAEFTVDLDSYMASEARAARFWVPPTTGVQVFLLPGLQVDRIGAGPDDSMSIGTLVSPPDLPGLGEITFSARVTLSIINHSMGYSLPAMELSMQIAPESALNIYDEGVTVARTHLGGLGPGETGPLDLTVNVVPGDDASSIIAAGPFRVGVSFQVDETSGETIETTMNVEEISCEIAFRVYSLFNLF